MKHEARTTESGFTLIELMIAMVVTVIITGAMFGLMSGSSSAFRREPELTERQQSIRVALHLLQQDVSRAGEHEGAFFQTFADGLNATGPASPSGRNDALEVYFNDGTCPDQPAKSGACPGPNCGHAGANINFDNPLPPCYSNNTFVLVIYQSGRSKFGFGHQIHAGGEKLNFPPGLQPPASYIDSVQGLADYCADNPPGCNVGSCVTGCGDPPVAIGGVSVMRYEVAMESDGITPGLWRSPTGGMIQGGGYQPPPSTAAGWQEIARGIEDFQVTYRNGLSPNWNDGPGVVTCMPNCSTPSVAAYNTMTREVRVMVQARTTAATHLQGETNVGGIAPGLGQSLAIRGQLTSTFTVRSTMMYLSQANPPLWQ